MDNIEKQIVESLQKATNVLVTVSTNPTVDQLAAAIGLTLLLNKMNKHGTAVFSGTTPSVLEFLEPEKTLEKNTDSLRDFIIALDKSKADKLRYKVEDSHVKIFITPYRASITEADLEFSQGDFNVEVVVALGVAEQTDLDAAITAHGRILHDATVISINTVPGGELGTLNWVGDHASSLCEMVVQLLESLDPGALDAQMATALLTGIVAETERFSNEKTSAQTMSLSSKLMAAGANQQLVATKLAEPATSDKLVTDETLISTEAEHKDSNTVTDEHELPAPVTDGQDASESSSSEDGSLLIDHEKVTAEKALEPIEELDDEAEPDLRQIKIDATGKLHDAESFQSPIEALEPPAEESRSRLVMSPPTWPGTLTASGTDELDPSTDPLSLPEANEPDSEKKGRRRLRRLLSHNSGKTDSGTPKEAQSPPTLDDLLAQAAESALPAAPATTEPSDLSKPAEVGVPDESAVPKHELSLEPLPEPALTAANNDALPVEITNGDPTLAELEQQVEKLQPVADAPLADSGLNADAALAAAQEAAQPSHAQEAAFNALPGIEESTPQASVDQAAPADPTVFSPIDNPIPETSQLISPTPNDDVKDSDVDELPPPPPPPVPPPMPLMPPFLPPQPGPGGPTST